MEYRRVTRSSDTYSGVEMGTLGPQSPQGPPPPTVLGPHRANPPDIRIDVQDTLAGYMAKGKGLKAAPPARAAKRAQWGKGDFWTVKGPKRRLSEALELVCKYGESYAQGYADAAAGLPPRGAHPPTSQPRPPTLY